MFSRKNNSGQSAGRTGGIRASDKPKSKAKYLQQIQTFASIPLRGSEQIFHTRLEELHTRILRNLSRFQLDTLLTIAREKVRSIVHLDPSPKLQQRTLKWAAVYFLVSCTTALRFASKRPSGPLIEHISLSASILEREALLIFAPHNSYGSPARLFNIILVPFARRLKTLNSNAFKQIHDRLGLSRGRQPVGFAVRSSNALENKSKAQSASASPEKQQMIKVRKGSAIDLSDPTKTSSATPIGQPFMIKVPHIGSLHLSGKQPRIKREQLEVEREERKTPIKQFKSPAPINAFKIMMESQEGGAFEQGFKKGRRPRSSACFETAMSQNMRLASTVDETLWAQSDDENPLLPYKHESKNIERALKRYNADLKKKNGMPALNLTSYFDEMATQ